MKLFVRPFSLEVRDRDRCLIHTGGYGTNVTGQWSDIPFFFHKSWLVCGKNVGRKQAFGV
jgi:hypothetical protein